jgi:hypothetical protein
MKIDIEEFNLLNINEIEMHRVDGNLFCQYRRGDCEGSQSFNIRMVIERSDVGVDDFKMLTVYELEQLFFKRLNEFLHNTSQPYVPNTLT